MIVCDASAAFDATTGRDLEDGLANRLMKEDDLAAPYLIDIEVLNALRRSVRTGRLTTDVASDALEDFADLALDRYPHEPFIDRIWELRNDLGAYDAAYLALAEAISIPLITCDAGLATVARRTVDVELYPPRA